jgi:hypothetical protein
MRLAAGRYDVHISTPPGGIGGADIEQLYVIKPVFSIDCGELGTPFVTRFLLDVKRSLMLWPYLG